MGQYKTFADYFDKYTVFIYHRQVWVITDYSRVIKRLLFFVQQTDVEELTFQNKCMLTVPT